MDIVKETEKLATTVRREEPIKRVIGPLREALFGEAKKGRSLLLQRRLDPSSRTFPFSSARRFPPTHRCLSVSVQLPQG